MTLTEIKSLFSPENEDKPTFKEKVEKNIRRIESLILCYPQLRNAAYKGQNFFEAIFEMNNKYSKKIKSETLASIKSELRLLIKALNSAPNSKKAQELVKFYPESYIRLIKMFKIENSKYLSRLNNIRKISEAYINGKISDDIYESEIRNQIAFFTNLYSKYANLSKDNAFALIFRYDTKTRKKKK